MLFYETGKKCYLSNKIKVYMINRRISTFRDTTQPAQFDLVIGSRPFAVNLTAPTGEMVRPVR